MSNTLINRIEEKPKTDITNWLITRYIVAVLGVWCAEFATYPLDLAKTRLQIQNEVKAATKLGVNQLEHKDLFATVFTIAKNEGPLKLFSGLMPMCQRHVLYAGSRLIFYERLRKLLTDEKGHMGLPRTVLCVIPNMQRAALINVGDLAAYDYVKRFLKKHIETQQGILLHIMAGFSAGLIAATLSTPTDVIKTRIMNQSIVPYGKGTLYSGMIDIFRQSVKNEGFFALYKGLMPIWIRLAPWALINWIAFERIMMIIRGKSF